MRIPRESCILIEMNNGYFGIDLAPGQGETILPDTFSGVDAAEAIQAMRDTIPDGVILPESASLLTIVQAADPLAIGESLRYRLEQQSPGLLVKLDEWRNEVE